MRTPRKDIDLWLTILATLPAPRDGWTQQEIASVCDCSQQAISIMERRALAKLREAAAKKKQPSSKH